MKTNDLIGDLVQKLEPIAPLRRPGARAAAWCLGAVLYAGLLVLAMTAGGKDVESDGALFWAAQIAAVVTGVLASFAAFASVVPGSSRHSLVSAILAALVWVGSLAAASSWDLDWARISAASHEWVCVGIIVIGGAPLMAALTVMLRRGAPLYPATTAALAALAVATLANVGACLAMPHANGSITFVWHGGTALALVLVAALMGRFAFGWTALR